MKQFFTPVDLRSRKAMTDFLSSHFRYYTMNSWNLSTSYACNLKIDCLGLNAEIVNKLFDLLETQEFFDSLKDLHDEFASVHSYRWQVGMNGRSGGYLVLYQGEAKPSQYRSYCTRCGQRNFTSVQETGTRCGACRAEARRDYTIPPLEICVYPGRGTDDDADYEEWSMSDLRDRVRLVQELDQLADAIVAQAIYLAQHYTVVEEEYLQPKTRKVLVPSA